MYAGPYDPGFLFCQGWKDPDGWQFNAENTKVKLRDTEYMKHLNGTAQQMLAGRCGAHAQFESRNCGVQVAMMPSIPISGLHLKKNCRSVIRVLSHRELKTFELHFTRAPKRRIHSRPHHSCHLHAACRRIGSLLGLASVDIPLERELAHFPPLVM